MVGTKFEPQENWIPPGYTVRFDKRQNKASKVVTDEVTDAVPSTDLSAARIVARKVRGGKRGRRGRPMKPPPPSAVEMADNPEMEVSRLIPYFLQVVMSGCEVTLGIQLIISSCTDAVDESSAALFLNLRWKLVMSKQVRGL